MTVSHYSGRQGGSARPSGSNAVKIIAAAAVVVAAVFVFVAITGGTKIAASKSGQQSFKAKKQEALDAATRFEVLFQTFDVKYPRTGAERLLALAGSDYEPILQEEINQITSASGAEAFDAARREGLDYVVNAQPISYLIERFDGARASIIIWSSTLAGIRTKAEPRLGFVRSRIVLRHAGDQWLVVSHEAMKPIVPYISAADGATREADYYRRQKGAEFYEQR